MSYININSILKRKFKSTVFNVLEGINYVIQGRKDHHHSFISINVKIKT